MPSISRSKRALFYAILALVAYLLVEAASVALHFVTQQELFSFSVIRAERQVILDAVDRVTPKEFGALAVGNPRGSVYEVLHPYLGFVVDPTRTPAYSELGFPDSEVRVYPKDPNRVVIGIFGGSFATGLSLSTKDVLMDRLKKSPRFSGKEIRILTVAMGGYKQPQQLLSLAYLVTLGAHFDIVVNLDGLNEVVLPAVENVPKGVFPFYPRNWAGRMGAFDATMQAFARKHANLVDDRTDWARLLSRAPLRFSVTANVAWQAWDHVIDNRLKEINVAALKHRVSGSAGGYTTRGPGRSYADEDALYDDLANVWKAASVQMKALAAANGMKYFHFLQPNQYVEGSKEMGPKERKIAYDEEHPYRKSVILGYPKLRKKGTELRKLGVPFFDLTTILAGHEEPLYVDSCCHLGKEGYDIIASRIAEEIANHH